MTFSWTSFVVFTFLLTFGALVGRALPDDPPEGEDEAPARLTEAELQSFRMDDLLRKQAAGKGPWLGFLRVPTLSCGVYVLPKGGRDGQGAHEQDEVYHVLSGRATLTVGPEEVPVEPGSVVFVKRGIDHRFHSIEEELKVLVFFAAGTGEEQDAK